MWVIPPKENAKFVSRMEDILDIYKRPYDNDYPVVCFDESNKQHLKDTREIIKMSKGNAERYDYEYIRNGVSNIFMFFEPLTGWCHVKVTDFRRSIDWAECMRELVEEHYPKAKKITLIEDNLNTHDPSSLYKKFPPKKAKSIWDKIDFHYTPKHGSWLNMAELQFSILFRECLDRRIPDQESLIKEISDWETDRNSKSITIDWQFETKDARIKLKKLYPTIYI